MTTTDNKKKLLLKAIKEYGGIIKARDEVGIPRSTFYQWQKQDQIFKEDVVEAKQSFGESMLQIAIDRIKNPDKGKGSYVLLIAVLNAYMSSTFKPGAADDNNEIVRDWIEELRDKFKADKLRNETPLSQPVEETLDSILDKKRNNDDTL